jgi:co-chaperonin GroES (HSP10)
MDPDEVENINSHQVFALGDGHVLVCNEGGDIEVGDYICSSNTSGHGMKQDDDILHNYTVAKATEAVNWTSEGQNTKLISCTYHAA